ncbi:hypothetical protein Bca4012_017097 [Brassica carinata]
MEEPSPSLCELPDDLILKIFSLLPFFKESVATNLLTKRWEDLMFDDNDKSYESLLEFVSFAYGSLSFNKSQILDIKLSWEYSASDINYLLKLAVKRDGGALRIQTFGKPLELPSCLSTCMTLKSLRLQGVKIKVVPPCFRFPSLKKLRLFSVKFSDYESLECFLRSCPDLEHLLQNTKTLTLSELSIEEVLPWFRLPSLKTLHLFSVKFSGDESIASFLPIYPVLEYLVVDQTEDDSVMFEDVPVWFCLPSLKSLHLLSVNFSGDESLSKLIERCPVLEDLVINKTRDDNVITFNINAPSLRSLSIDNSKGTRVYVEKNHGFVIDAPSLEKMDFKDTFSNFLVFEHMPEVTEANIQVICGQSENFIGSLTSIRQLSLCSLSSETPYPSGTTFPYLEHLELCTCSAGWANLLVCLLNDAPTLNYLKLKSVCRCPLHDPMIHWKEATAVPESLSTHLEIMEWRQYEGREQERNVAAYILGNATCLKMATFSTRCRNKHHSMLRKLKNLKRVSETCQLLFD